MVCGWWNGSGSFFGGNGSNTCFERSKCGFGARIFNLQQICQYVSHYTCHQMSVIIRITYTDMSINMVEYIISEGEWGTETNGKQKGGKYKAILCPKPAKEMVREECKPRGMLKILRPTYATLSKEVVPTENCLWTTGGRIFCLGKTASSTTLVPNTKHQILSPFIPTSTSAPAQTKEKWHLQTNIACTVCSDLPLQSLAAKTLPAHYNTTTCTYEICKPKQHKC